MPDSNYSRSARANPPSAPPASGFQPPELDALNDRDRVSLCEMLDRLLNKGVVVVGEITISVADVDLLYLGLNLVLTSMETAFLQSEGSAAIRTGAGVKGSAHGSF
jgi:hypothetical protein